MMYNSLMDNRETLQKIVRPLLGWYAQCARVLPWRENHDPYRVWVSEIMLQQTRVDTVIPYYLRFLEQLPDIPTLAAAPEEQLLKLWEGLGYYSRVRSMQKAARLAVEKYDGQLPGSVEELKKLPGIGEYTAGAIGSIAFGLPVPAVDGNVLRVVSRIINSHKDVADPKVKTEITELVTAVLPTDCVGDFNQALMDLGATICLPGANPRCEACPLKDLCRGFAAGTAGELPVKAQKAPRKIQERTVFVLRRGDTLALHRRPDGGLLGGLWELPGVEEPLDVDRSAIILREWGLELMEELQKQPAAKHVFTHVEWHMTVYATEVKSQTEGFTWVTGEQMREAYMLPSAFLKIQTVKQFLEE